MNIKNWNIHVNANLEDGAEYSKSFYSDMSLNHATLEEVIEWLKRFKENVIIIKREEKE